MKTGSSQQEWYTRWFNSPYYHILYKNRDDREARSFLDRLIDHLRLSPQARILDLACGQGRHAIYLNGKGFRVTGVDLAPHNIEAASRSQREGLDFFVHDIREVFAPAHFQLVLNLFTSFGYFQDPADNERVIKTVQQELEPGGLFVLDFFNVPCVLLGLVHEEEKVVDGIRFHLHRQMDQGTLVKTIRFHDQGRDYVFEERVRAFSFADLKLMFARFGLQVQAAFGDYDLSTYNEGSSPRLILVAKKETT